MSVGYVGLGAMGRALARHLAAPYDLIVHDLNPAATDELVSAGASAAGSLADLARRCDIVILCLPKSANVAQVLFGENGLAGHLAPGSVVVDQTSGVPATTRDFAARLAQRDVAMIDAPVAGGVPSAIAGQITIMASGPAGAFDRVRPVLTAISPKLFRCSDRVGDGQVTKAINNLVNTGYRMATLELLGLARRMGCSTGALTDVLNAGPARSFVTQRLLPAIVEARSSADFALGLMCKDVNQAADFALESEVAMPVCDAARGLMTAAWNLLGPDSRLDDLVPFMERATAATFAGGATGEAPAEAMRLIEAALAAANNAIMAESIALAERAGLSLAGFAPVMAAGSGASVQADLLFAGGSALPDALDALGALSRSAAELGVPLTVTSQVRAHYLANAPDTRRTAA